MNNYDFVQMQQRAREQYESELKRFNNKLIEYESMGKGKDSFDCLFRDYTMLYEKYRELKAYNKTLIRQKSLIESELRVKLKKNPHINPINTIIPTFLSFLTLLIDNKDIYSYIIIYASFWYIIHSICKVFEYFLCKYNKKRRNISDGQKKFLKKITPNAIVNYETGEILSPVFGWKKIPDYNSLNFEK